MTIRSKIIAAAVSLALATGAAGGAFAQTGTTATPAEATSTLPTKTTPQQTKSAEVTTPKRHSLKMSHRMLHHRLVAHRVAGHGKIAHKGLRTHVGTLTRHHLVKSGFIKTHVAKGVITKSALIKSRTAGFQKHASAARISKRTVIR